VYTILIEFGIPSQLVRQLKRLYTKPIIKSIINEYLSGAFPVRNGLGRKEMRYLHSSSTSLQNISLGKDWNWMEHISFWYILMTAYRAKTFGKTQKVH